MTHSRPADEVVVYKICDQAEWSAASTQQTYAGNTDDLRDGFIHLSALHQLAGTLARHFASRQDLVLIAVAVSKLGQNLRWEASRGGDQFPHLYAPLPLAAALKAWPITLGGDGVHQLPELTSLEQRRA